MVQTCSFAARTGEVHLETIIKDLRHRFARVELSVSPPLVAFRESVFIEAEAPEPGHKPPKVTAFMAPFSYKCMLASLHSFLNP